MVSVDVIAKRSKQLLYDMNAGELKQMLMDLVRRYYISYIKNDIDAMESIRNKINEIMVVYDDADEIKEYFNYCIAMNSNILIKSILRKDGELLEPFSTGTDKKFESIHERVKKNVEYFKALDEMIMQD